MSIKFAPRPETRSQSQIEANYRTGSRGLGEICGLCIHCDMVYNVRFCSIHEKKITQDYKCDLGEFKKSRKGVIE